MKDTSTIVVVFVIVFFVGLGGTYLFFMRDSIWDSRGNDRSIGVVPDANIFIDEEGMQLENIVSIGTGGIHGSTFEKVQNGFVYFEEKGTSTSMALNAGEVAIQCTDQPLISATEFDFDKVSKVLVLPPSEVSDLIPPGEAIVLFAEEKDVLRVHTIAVSSSVCDF